MKRTRIRKEFDRAPGITSWGLELMVEQLRLNPYEKDVLKSMAHYYPTVFPSVATIAARAELCRRTGQRNIKKLEEKGYITPLDPKKLGGRGNSVQYVINVEKVLRDAEESQKNEGVVSSQVSSHLRRFVSRRNGGRPRVFLNDNARKQAWRIRQRLLKRVTDSHRYQKVKGDNLSQEQHHM